MPYIVTDVCIGTKNLACLDVCPVDCIYEIDEMVVISPSECIDCGACQPQCPVDAISTDADIDPGRAAFVDINAAWDAGGAEAATAALSAWKAGAGAAQASPPAAEG